MKKIHYNKLIRDRIPLVMKKSGASFTVSTLTKSRFREELLKKVGEEASALPSLRKNKDIANELADVIAVVEAIKNEFHITDQELKKELKAAFKKKGGFSKRLFLHWAADTGYRTNERRYKR